MASRELKVGDVVVLRSGGPKMTVLGVEDRRAYCTWFGSPIMPTPAATDFPVDALEVIEERR